MAANNKTSLSAGSVIRDILLKSARVTSYTTKIFPVATDQAILPYILYRRAALEHNPTKAGAPGADTVTIEILCYADSYAESIDLAESVRAALDYAQRDNGVLQMRSCTLVDSEESWEADAYMQFLSFKVKI